MQQLKNETESEMCVRFVGGVLAEVYGVEYPRVEAVINTSSNLAECWD